MVDMAHPVSVISLSNPVFSSLAFCASALIIKMFALALYTAVLRFKNTAYENAEDAAHVPKKDGKVTLKRSEHVERVRRNHLNDLENIPAFIVIALLYTLTDPLPSTAIWHFRIFTALRFLHTFCYQFAIPQPSRALMYLAGVAVTISMAVQIIMEATI